ncbi:hypothetical protein Ancab_032248 [Ancistrocladus abbreviatus]
MASCCNLTPISVLHKLSVYVPACSSRTVQVSCHFSYCFNQMKLLNVIPLSPRSSISSPVVHAATRLSCFSPADKNFLRNVTECPKGKNHERFQCTSFNLGEKSSNIADKEDEVGISQATLVWRAIKLPMYSVALVPLTVASAAAYMQTGIFFAARYFGLLASSIFIIAWLNLSNDVYDFDTGADMNKKESVVNMVGSRTGTFVAAYLFLALGILGLTLVAMEAGNWRSLLLLGSAIMCGYIYQCPPLRLSYHGLGEPLCFAAFGPFATTAFYLMQNGLREEYYLHSLSTVLSASILVGCTTTLILFCSHFHQVEGDRAVGKFSPLVRIGTKTGSEVVKISVSMLYFVVFILGLGRVLPLVAIVFCALTFPLGNLVMRYVKENYNDKAKIFMAKYYCVRLHSLFGLALAAGLVAARKLSSYSPIRILA